MLKKLDTQFLLKDKEVSQEKYDEMLGALPPIRMTDNAFLVGEAYDHAKDLSGRFGARYDLYFMEKGKCFYGGLTSVGDFDAFVIKEVCGHCGGKMVNGMCDAPLSVAD